MKELLIVMICAGLAGATAACGGDKSADTAVSGTGGSSVGGAAAAATGQIPNGDNGVSNITSLQKTDVKVGTGAEAASGHTVSVQYTGWLYSASAADHHGTKFDSSRDRNEPLEFRLGAGQVIKGWDQGVAGMKVGGQRTLVIPPDLGYGGRGAGGIIPPNATLVFDVELLGVR
jgi:FKBP-type peptidyl-prolyl cis-trans isomerase